MADTTSSPAPEVVVEAKLVDKKRLYVSWAVTDQSLIAVAKSASPESKVVEARALSGPARAFGFVTFATEEEAAAALAAMNGKTITTEPIQVDFAKAATGEKKPRPNRRGQPKKEGKSSGAPAKKKEGAKRPSSAKKAPAATSEGATDNGAPKPKGPKRERTERPKKAPKAESAPAAATTEAPKSARGPNPKKSENPKGPKPKKEKAATSA